MGMEEDQKCRDSKCGWDIFPCFEYHTQDKEIREEDNEDQSIWSEFTAQEDLTVFGC